jgi:hypothetical protein
MEQIEAAESAFVAGAMWAARELGHPESEAVAFLELAQAAARDGYGFDEREGG